MVSVPSPKRFSGIVAAAKSKQWLNLEIDSEIFCTNTAISSFVHVESVTNIKIRLNNTAAVKWRIFAKLICADETDIICTVTCLLLLKCRQQFCSAQMLKTYVELK